MDPRGGKTETFNFGAKNVKGGVPSLLDELASHIRSLEVSVDNVMAMTLIRCHDLTGELVLAFRVTIYMGDESHEAVT